MPKKLKKYKVYYSKNSSAVVKAYSVKGARNQAWSMLGHFKYGWAKADFMSNATVKEVF